MAHDVFICHADQDKKTADAVYAALEKNGIKCWIARHDVTAGKDWDDAIAEALSQCRILVLVFSAHSNDSKYCRNEVHIAFDKKKEIIPFRIDEKTPSGAMELYLTNKQWIDAKTPPSELHLKRLVDEVRKLLPQPIVTKETEEVKKVSEPVIKAVKKPEIKKPIKLRKIWLGVGCILLAIVVIGVTLKFTVFTEVQTITNGEKEMVTAGANTSENVTPTAEIANLNYVEGYVYDAATNAPIADATIDLLEQVALSTKETYEAIRASGYSDSKGYYKTESFNGTGKYLLRVNSWGYVTQWHMNANDINQAKQITFNPGEKFNISFFLVKCGSISGKVISRITGKAYVGQLWVYLLDAAGHEITTSALLLNSAGEYIVNNIAPGYYYIRIDTIFDIIVIYYDNSPDISGATLVKVISGEDTPNIDFILDVS